MDNSKYVLSFNPSPISLTDLASRPSYIVNPQPPKPIYLYSEHSIQLSTTQHHLQVIILVKDLKLNLLMILIMMVYQGLNRLIGNVLNMLRGFWII